MKPVDHPDIPKPEAPMSYRDKISRILSSASAFKEVELMEKAAAEYNRVLEVNLSRFDFSFDRIFSEWLECVATKSSPGKVIKLADDVLGRHKLSAKDKARARFALGRELEKRKHKLLAHKQYKLAREIDGENREIREKCNALSISLSGESRYGYLIENKLVTGEQLKQALAISQESNKSVELILIERFKVKRKQVAKSLSQFYHCPVINFDPDCQIPVELIGKLKKAFLIHYTWVPLNWSKDGVEVLVDDPTDLRKTDHIKALMATSNIRFAVGIKEEIVKFIELFFKPKEEDFKENDLADLDDIIADITFEAEDEIEEELEIVDESSSQVVRFVDQVLVAAFRKGASDIHIEPSPISKTTNVRFRMDGVCHEYTQVPNTMAPGILSRLKIMAGLDIAEKRLPQDGKIKMKRKGISTFELRMSTMPSAGGFEDVVLRILAKAGAMKLHDMGLNDRNLGILKKIIVQPYGLILVVGPTGSGKTTTLHSALGHINKPEIKIWTAEDPVEITQPGLRQVEAKAKIGLDFARIMRGFLRLDPDVIMIGEMRDEETASIGVEASLTGHLVFSTLHTNSAPETITRLLDMGLNPLNFSDAFLGVLAQRLVRRLCKNCREAYPVSAEEFSEIVDHYGREQFKGAGIEHHEKLTLYRPVGCDKCSDSGYKGRMGIHEMMEGTKTVKDLIKKQAPTEKLFNQAFEDGMTTLKQDGICKVFQGLTDMKEIRRVCID
jgi:type II secretory ATPase GspE/PulE/Tfp pilus assembly ATPase PilB-like protein